MDCSPPGSSVHGISQARILEWPAISPPGDLPDPRIELVSLTLAGSFKKKKKKKHWATREVLLNPYIHLKNLFLEALDSTYAKKKHDHSLYTCISFCNFFLDKWQYHPTIHADHSLTTCLTVSFLLFPTSNLPLSSLSHPTNMSWFNFLLHLICYSPSQGLVIPYVLLV